MVIRIFEVEETADWEASIWIPVVISRRPARRAWSRGRQKGKMPDKGGGCGKDKNVAGYTDNN